MAYRSSAQRWSSAAERGSSAAQRGFSSAQRGSGAAQRGSWRIALGACSVIASGLLLMRAAGPWPGDAVAWPALVAIGGALLIWRSPVSLLPRDRGWAAHRSFSPREASAALGSAARLLPRPQVSRRGVGITLVLGESLKAAAVEVEDAARAAVEVVVVGESELDVPAAATLAAAKEAMLNAAKFAGNGAVSVFAELSPQRIVVYVRDRGPGFDVTSVPGERHGVRESIIGRMRRAGGRATVRSAPGTGTEIELTLERGPA